MSNKWEKRFLDLAKEISTWSKNPRSKVGSVIVNSNNQVLSVGYNGFPRGIEDSERRLNNDQDRHELMAHAERNAMDNAQFDLSNSTIYSTRFPCLDCAKGIIQRRIKSIVSPEPEIKHTIWGKDQTRALGLLEEAGLKITALKIERVFGTGLKLIMALSEDFYYAEHEHDKMKWTGDSDKQLFTALTLVGEVCGISSKSRSLMPIRLGGRFLVPLSKTGTTLQSFASTNPGAWLLGGGILATKAWNLNLLDEIHISLCPVKLNKGLPAPSFIRDLFLSGAWVHRHQVGNVEHIIFRFKHL